MLVTSQGGFPNRVTALRQTHKHEIDHYHLHKF